MNVIDHPMRGVAFAHALPPSGVPFGFFPSPQISRLTRRRDLPATTGESNSLFIMD